MALFSRSDPDDGPVAVPFSTSRPITAAAVRINLANKNEVEAVKARRQADKWQEDAWAYYDLIGEIKYAANLIASVTSRVRLYVGWVSDNDIAPANIQNVEDVPDELKARSAEALRLLESGNGGIAGLLRDAALNLFVSGECALVKEPAPFGSLYGLDTWNIRSTSEIVAMDGRGTALGIKPRRNATPKEYIKLDRNAFIGRIWRTHPQWSDEADSSLRGILDDCDQLLLYNRASRALTKTRIPAGILLMPDELSNASQADGEIDENENPSNIIAPLSDDESQSFEEEFIDSIVTPIADETSAASVAPMVVRGPAEFLEKIRHLTFDRPLDGQISAQAERTLERILSALDLPKDIVSGMASVKYSNAITIEESLYKAHIEPLVLLIVDSLTVVFLRQVLINLGFTPEDVMRVVVWYDPSAITTKPDKATAATTGFEMQTISAKAWRRANGFSETDAPTELEIAQRMAVEKGLLSEPIMDALLYTLIPDLLNKVRADQQGMTDEGTLSEVQDAVNGVKSDPAPSTSDNPDESSPEPPAGLIEP